jgi:dephospho-CoA kinase
MVAAGLTGGIGSGKSTAANFLRDLGAHILDADRLAKDLLNTDRDIRQEIIQVFGAGLYSRQDFLDRDKLARVVFDDSRALQKLNAIVHPAVIARIQSEIGKYRKRKGPMVIEAALFYEAGIDTIVDYMIVVDAEEEIRVQRVMKREGCTRSDVMKRIKLQMPAGEKVKRADFVMLNSGPLSELSKKCLFLYGLLKMLDPAEGR